MRHLFSPVIWLLDAFGDFQQKLQQVGHLLVIELLLHPFRHECLAGAFDFFDVFAQDRDGLILVSFQNDTCRRL